MDAEARRGLLDHLDGLNAALLRRGAVPDITVDEARGIRELETLGHIVDATARRLALLMDLAR